MSRKNNRLKGKRTSKNININVEFSSTEYYEKEVKPFKPITVAQSNYIKAINNNTIILVDGPAGTGKTKVAVSLAAEKLKSDPFFKLILIRPAITSEEDLGHLPGTLEEKYSPYIEPFMDYLEESLGKSHVRNLVKNERIIAKPIAYLRGKTFKDCWVILDEAQNTTPEQMKLVLTRIGENAKLIVDGDIDQTDIQGQNGLSDAIDRLYNIQGIKVVTFTEDDIVRHGLIKYILKAYRD